MLSPLVAGPHEQYTQAAPRIPRPSVSMTSPQIFPEDLQMKQIN